MQKKKKRMYDGGKSVLHARKYDATGRGQDKMCYEEGAFDQSLEFYHESKQF